MLSNVKIHVYDFFKIFIILYSKKSQRIYSYFFFLFFLFPSKVEKPYIPEFIYKHFPDPNYTFHNTKKNKVQVETQHFKLILTTLTPHDSAVHDYLKMKSCKIEDELVFVCFFCLCYKNLLFFMKT